MLSKHRPAPTSEYLPTDTWQCILSHMRLDHTMQPQTASSNSTQLHVHRLPSFMSTSSMAATLSCYRRFADLAEQKQTHKQLPKYSQAMTL